MSKLRLTHLGLIVAAISFTSFAVMTSVHAAEAAATAPAKVETVRPEVGKPLNAAQELIKQKNYADALVQVRLADSVGELTPFEAFSIDRMMALLSAATGDDITAIKSLEAVIATGRLPAAEQSVYIQTLAQEYYKVKDYPKTISTATRYFKEGGTDAKTRNMLIQAYYQNNEFAKVEAEISADIAAQEKAGNAPSADQLKMLINCEKQLHGDKSAGYAAAIEKIATYYPEKQYWDFLLNRVQLQPGFSDAYLLDVYRLKLAVGPLDNAKQYSDVAQLANAKGFSAESQKILAQKSQSGMLKMPFELAKSQQCVATGKTGIGLINAGYDCVTQGKFDQGLNLMEQGLHKDDLKRPDEAKLHTGIAYAMAGRKADAINMFKTVQGTDGAADLARYWVIQLSRPVSQ
ncbi:hypothetical protein [Glaciimonas soli]|uniref:Tetratricopeptide repeat protein n=1 Tax=Glaciimonas soli TaxID=2590999 RepID=A0A843YWN1_9BURK|nr:hypothetical protein [Glaciimonas soli]MQR01632.1 hypothetical protein [Glaciimonas soli]